MNLTFWYGIGMAALAVMCLYHTASIALSFLYFYFKVGLCKHFFYPLLVRRRYWGSVTRVQTLLVSGYVVVNGICMGLGIRTTSDLVSRSGIMACINIIPLFFGGRTSMIANFLGISLHTYYLAHHWIGRVVILQGLVHVGLVLSSNPKWTFDSFQIAGISAASSMSLILVCSLYFVRKLVYELFLKLHLLLALICIVAITGHLMPLGLARSSFPIAAITLWCLNTLARLAQIVYHNVGDTLGSRNSRISIMHHMDTKGSSVTAMTVQIKMKRRFQVYPGQYFYLFLTDLGLRRRFQAHPFVVTWWDDSVEASLVSFLIQPQAGLSADLIHRNSIRSVVLDGPYGKNYHVEDHDTVILIAKGIGIAGVLPYARHLVDMKFHHDRKYRRTLITRKVDLFWVMDDNSQEQWISKWLSELKDKDTGRTLLSVWCYYPNKKLNEPSFKCDEYYRCFYEEVPQLKDLIKAEVDGSPGRTIVGVCGTGDFTGSIRNIVTETVSQSTEVKFVEVEFRPRGVRQAYSEPSSIDRGWMEQSGRELTSVKMEERKPPVGPQAKPRSRLSVIEEGLEKIIAAREFA